MAENTPYFQMVTDNRSALLSEEEALRGGQLIGAEAADVASSTELTFIENHFDSFLKALRFLSKENQDLLLAYYLLNKPQYDLAEVFSTTQTLISTAIRGAMATLAAHIMMGEITAEKLAPVFERTGWEHKLAAPLSEIVEMFADTRSFAMVAIEFGLHRPAMRRTMKDAAKALRESKNVVDCAVGAYLWDLVDKASTCGTGLTEREEKKLADVHVKTPAILGQFRISVTDPDFDQIFAARSACM